ncbi:MAG: TIM barrel protein [Anaerolineaceae bacterium]|nr:TIM barrel protein [Anaerolineaceae bacterium]
MKYSVFTVCMPEYPPEEAVKRLKKWGYDGVEWRFYNRPEKVDPQGGFWAGNRATIDPRHWREEVPAVKRLCRQAGLKTPALAAYASCTDPKQYKPAIEAAAALGAPLVRVGVPRYDKTIGWKKLYAKAVRSYEKVVKYAARFKVRPVVEIHMGIITASAAAAAQFCGNFSPRRIGIIYDPGNMVYEGYEQYQMGLEMLGPYLAHVHVKNSRWDVAGATRDGAVVWKPSFAPMKNGFVDFEELVRSLQAVGYNGWLSFEDFNPDKKTDQKLVEDLKFLKAIERRCK